MQWTCYIHERRHDGFVMKTSHVIAEVGSNFKLGDFLWFIDIILMFEFSGQVYITYSKNVLTHMKSALNLDCYEH